MEEAGHVAVRAEGRDGAVEGLQRAVMREIPTEVPADDVARIHVASEEQIREGVAREAQVRDVADHGLSGACDHGVLQAIRRDDVAVLRVGGERATPLPRDQCIPRPEPREELVAPDHESGPRQMRVQLARPHPGLVLAHGGDVRQH